MDPYYLEILEVSDSAVPLDQDHFHASIKDPSLNVICHSSMTEYPAVIYEIWRAGISQDILKQVFLQASYNWKGLYETTSEVTATYEDLQLQCKMSVIILPGQDGCRVLFTTSSPHAA